MKTSDNGNNGKEYDHSAIEKKWQAVWEKKKTYRAKGPAAGSANVQNTDKKFYSLIEFPYPSGDGLHVGHPRPYIGMDVISRKRRMEGYNVLYPIGWDAFGLPTENYAIKTGKDPRTVTKENTATFTRQIKSLGVSFDWSREINTTDPRYYKWTQWIFLQFLKAGLAYKKKMAVNWCPKDLIVLANEEVVDGRCERCGTAVEKREKEQWMLAITKYADKLLEGLDATEYYDPVTGADYIMPQLVDKTNPHQPDKPVVRRNVVHAIVFDPHAKKYLIIRNKKFAWDTVIIGGIENGEDPASAARREVREETGYTDLDFKRILGGPTEAHYYTKHKGENRIAIAQAAYFEIKSAAHDTRVPIADDEDRDNEILWIDETDFVPGKMVNSELGIWLERLKDPSKSLARPLLDWPESIKESQRNWIGRSEGAEIDFVLDFKKHPGDNERRGPDGKPAHLTVFTTRPDTLFGVTYLVLAPEHLWVKLAIDAAHDVLENKADVIAYVQSARAKSDIERTALGKEKTGVELKGVKAVNPATGEKIPLYVADYVLADYGTGAVMAVPAHDERDFEFAKKYGLPVKQVIAWETGIQREGEERRDGGCAVIFDPKTQKYAFGKLTDGKYDLYGGGVDKNEDLIKGILREVEEESGLYDFSHIEKIDDAFVHYYNFKKKVARSARATCLLLVLKTDAKKDLKLEAHEDYTTTWSGPDGIIQWWHDNNKNHDFDHWEIFMKNGVSRAIELGYDTTNLGYKGMQKAYTGSGMLINSGEFDDRNSEKARGLITKKFGRNVTTYKLRDWVFSRQRYWGEPIPVIHCEKCGVVPVPDEDLPVELPEVKNYKPTETGESPLAAISKWVNVKCPKCSGKAKRETDTMPNWAGSSWYYLRYTDPGNAREFASPEALKYWTPVDWYNGGNEHTTLHLLYSRFWHRFLYDQGLVPTPEPYRKRTSHGLILAKGGEKMSKSKGNVVNPDGIVAAVGADSLRLYEMFMGPFDQAIAWDENGIVGTRRFIEKVWKLAEKVPPEEIRPSEKAETLIHKTVKKVSEDIEAMHFNTAVSALMIAVNDLEKMPAVSREHYRILLGLLAPFAPHVTEELWHRLGFAPGPDASIHAEPWPACDPAKIAEKNVRIAVQINGKTRASFEVPADAADDEAVIREKALALDEIKNKVYGKDIKRVIYVKGRLINIVID